MNNIFINACIVYFITSFIYGTFLFMKMANSKLVIQNTADMSICSFVSVYVGGMLVNWVLASILLFPMLFNGIIGYVMKLFY